MRDLSQAALLMGAEGLNVGCIDFTDQAGSMDAVIQCNQYTQAVRLRRGGQQYGVVQIQWPIGAQGGSWPHGPHQYNRFGAFYDKVQAEIGRASCRERVCQYV